MILGPRHVYREDIRQDNRKAMVYIVYILDDNSDNIPIQVIESNKTYRFEYRSGSIENDLPITGEEEYVLGSRGIQQHICDILEGGKTAFDLRMHKYRM